MVAETTLLQHTFSGSDDQKALAERMFQALRAQGMFASDYAPIRVRLNALASFLGVAEEDAQGAAATNEAVFAVEHRDDETWIVTTRLGTPPVEMVQDTRHSFVDRLMTPEPAPDRPLRTEKVVPEILVPTEVGAAIGDARSEEKLIEAELRRETERGYTVELVPQQAAPVEVPEVEAEPDVEPVTIERVADPRGAEADVVEVESVETALPPTGESAIAPDAEPAAVAEEVTPAADDAAVAEVVAPDVESAPVTEEVTAAADDAAVAEAVAPDIEPVETTEEITPAADDAAVAEEVTPDVEPAAVAEPRISLTDLSAYDDDSVAEAIRESLRADARAANFADQWMVEDRVARLREPARAGRIHQRAGTAAYR
jgi:hypothetical protein